MKKNRYFCNFLIKRCTIKLATDTSSLIILQKAELLNFAADAFTLCIPHSVWFEWNKKAPCNQAVQLSALVQQYDIPDPVKIKNGKMSRTDRHVIQLYHQESCDALLSEDGVILRFCAAHHIPHFSAPSLTLKMHLMGFISHKTCVQWINKMTLIGRYSPWVLDYLRHALETTIESHKAE